MNLTKETKINIFTASVYYSKNTEMTLICWHINPLLCILSPYLTYMRSTSWETLDWKKHKLESRLPGEISITSDMQMTAPYGRKWRRIKSLLMRVKEKSAKVGLKLNITSWQIDGETVEQWLIYFGGAPKSLQMVTAAMKLKDVYSLEEKL